MGVCRVCSCGDDAGVRGRRPCLQTIEGGYEQCPPHPHHISFGFLCGPFAVGSCIFSHLIQEESAPIVARGGYDAFWEPVDLPFPFQCFPSRGQYLME